MDLLAQMATFVQVVDGRSLSAAARAQRLSLAAVSRQLQALETELGAALVLRSTRSLHVTEAGRRWYEHCLRVLREVEDAKAAVSGDDVARGTLVVSASMTYGTQLIVPRLRALAERHPRLVIELQLEDRLVDLVGDGVDLAVRAGSLPPDSTAYVAHRVSTMQRVLVASPRWLRKHGTPRTPADLARHECLIQITRSAGEVRWQLRRGDEEETVAVRGRLRASAPLPLRDLAVDGAGIAYIPDGLVEGDVAAGRLKRILPAWGSPPLAAYAIHRAELRGSARVRAFLDALKT